MKVLLATGGSGGHIFPALQTALQLRRRGHTVVFAGALGMARERIIAEGFECHVIPGRGLQKRSPLELLRFGISMTVALCNALKAVGGIKPRAILGFGGYGSFAVISAGWILRYPVMIHEQNVVPGRANAWMAKMARQVAVSFKDSHIYFSNAKTVWTGCPCHNQAWEGPREEVYERFGLDPQRKTIVLLGGSQGSQKLNEVFFAAMPSFNEKGLQAVHLTGVKEYPVYVEKYRQARLPALVSSFYSPIEELYAIADIVVARSGAATVSELGDFAIPSVLVPYPFAGGHQKYNAQVLSNVGAAILIEQKELTVQALQEAVERCLGPDFSKQNIRTKVWGLFNPHAAAALAQAVEEVFF